MLKQLKVKHREIGRLKFEGFSPAEIAERTDMKVGSVYAILRDEMCKSYMNGLADRADEHVINVRKQLATMNTSALEAIKGILQKGSGTPPAVKLAAAKDVLDRNGYNAPEKHEHLVAHFTADDLAKLKNRSKDVDLTYLN